MKLFDTHTHFDFRCFDSDRSQVWSRFQALGGQRLLMAGVSQSQWQRAAQLCESNPAWSMSVGYHPLFLSAEPHSTSYDDSASADATTGVPARSLADVDTVQLSAQLTEALSRYDEYVVAIGECGLDRFAATAMQEQQRVLQIQLAIAKSVQRPVILHCRGAHNELLQAIDQTGVSSGVIHAFSGSVELAREYIRRGFKVGVGGTISYARAAKTQRTIAQLPLTELLLETDSPDMPHSGHQGQRNEPSYCRNTIAQLTMLREEDEETIAEQLWQNALILFGK
ncbi:TatD family hydrolase [Umboniibacter marinipuniceus]|uniref:TatD DNase family protein n=1 Tax=Umboniibacter marinipuniceus TaxID=569599 RepID=A0A3M0ABN5_9GAMM|nr:TatD family hydrolase [Umboniibacter marinipuniceus]RMA80188.1 TatD DNase family protein [Umboniibacter marinipuniceus]